MPTSTTPARPRRRQTLRQWLVELAKFGAIGGLAYIIDAGGFNLLVYGPGEVLGPHPVTAKILSACVATLFAWVGNRYWTFADAKRSTPGRELVMFLLVNAGGILVAAATLWTSRYVLGYTSQLADNIAGNIIGVGLGTIFRYVCYRYVVFTGDADDAPPKQTSPAAVPHQD